MPVDPYAEFGGSQVNSSSSSDPYAEFGGSMSIPSLIAPSPFRSAGPPPAPPSEWEGVKGLAKGVAREIIKPADVGGVMGDTDNWTPPQSLRYTSPTQSAVGNFVSNLGTAVGISEGAQGLVGLGADMYLAAKAKGATQALKDAAAANPLARLITKAERHNGPIRGPGPPIKTKTGISEQDLQAIREGGAETRRSSAQFVKDVISRRGLPTDPSMVQAEAAQRGRILELEKKYPVPQFESLKDPFAAPEGMTLGYPKTPDPYIGKNVPEMQPVQSTNINRAGYHPESKTMMVEYKNGRVYEYKGVEPDTFKEFQNAESQGSYVSQNIKGKYKTNYRGSVLGKPQAKPMAAD